MPNHPKRKKYIIDKKFQLAIVFKFFLLIIVTAGLILLTIELFFDKPYKFMPQGKTVLRYRDVPEYTNNELKSFRRVNKKEKELSIIKLEYYNNGKIKFRIVFDAHKKETGREQYIYNYSGILIAKHVIRERKIIQRNTYDYQNGLIVKEIVYDASGKALRYGVYKYNTEELNGRKILQSKTFYSSVNGAASQKEIYRWEYFYDMQNNRIEEQYKRKDGSLYLFKIRKFADSTFKRLEYVVVYEDRFSDQFRDFLFKPIYNKDGDIIGLQGEPVNRYNLMITPIIFTSGIMLVVVLVFGLIISHRLAGPLYHIRRYVEAMQRGEFGKSLKLRKSDEFRNLAELLEDLSRSLAFRYHTDNNHGDETENSSSSATASKKSKSKMRKMMKRIFKRKTGKSSD